jgi:hypothetical protein
MPTLVGNVLLSYIQIDGGPPPCKEGCCCFSHKEKGFFSIVFERKTDCHDARANRKLLESSYELLDKPRLCTGTIIIEDRGPLKICLKNILVAKGNALKVPLLDNLEGFFYKDWNNFYSYHLASDKGLHPKASAPSPTPQFKKSVRGTDLSKVDKVFQGCQRGFAIGIKFFFSLTHSKLFCHAKGILEEIEIEKGEIRTTERKRGVVL